VSNLGWVLLQVQHHRAGHGTTDGLFNATAGVGAGDCVQSQPCTAAHLRSHTEEDARRLKNLIKFDEIFQYQLIQSIKEGRNK
jgi:hypothetical protein